MGKKRANTKDKRKYLNTKGRRLVLVFVIIFIPLVLFDLSPFGGGIKFYSKWIECGKKPVKTAGAPGIIWYEEPNSFDVVRSGYQTYYCSPLQAEQAGYSANSSSYVFPNLHKNSQQK